MFSPAAIDALHHTGLLADEFFDYLQGVRFTSKVWAIPAGRLSFVDEPVVEVTAPVAEVEAIKRQGKMPEDRR